MNVSNNMAKVFISYSRKDTDFVRKLAGDLEKAGYDVWWDLSDLRGGDDWVNTIPAAIASSQYVIVVLTPDATESEWVRKEYTQALSLRRKIIPILLKPGNVPFALNTINFVNFTSGEYEDRFKELLSALDFTGPPPEVTPYRKAFLSLSPAFLKFGIPALIGILILLAFSLIPRTIPPTETPTATHTASPSFTVSPTFAATLTESPTPTATQSASPTASQTISPTLTPTQPTVTPSPTKQPFRSIELCVKKIDARNINVRAGPSSELYEIVGFIPVDTCLLFSAVYENTRGETWLQVASGQPDPEIRNLAGGWISANLLEVDLTAPIPLPVVTLTPTPTPSNTPTITPTLTRTPSPTMTPSETPTETTSPTDTQSVETATETPTP